MGLQQSITQNQIKEVISRAKFGDLVEISYPIGYSHWAVYEKNGYVIHFAVADEKKLMTAIQNRSKDIKPNSRPVILGRTKIRRTHFHDVHIPPGSKVSINNNQHALKASDSCTVRRRLSALLDKDCSYDLVFFNCEHFATFVRYGKSVCNQNLFLTKDTELTTATAAFQAIVAKSEWSCILS